MATSDYEKIRLENIQKNAEFLRELGFNDIHSSSDSKPKGPQLTEKKSIRNLKRKRNVESNKEEQSLYETGKDQLPRIGTRQSARIRQGKIETKTVHDFSIDAIRKSQERQLEFIKEYEGNERASIIDIDLNDEHMERNKINAELLRNAIEEASISHSNSISNQVLSTLCILIIFNNASYKCCFIPTIALRRIL